MRPPVILHYQYLLQFFLGFPEFQREGINGDFKFRPFLHMFDCGSLYPLCLLPVEVYLMRTIQETNLGV